MQRIKSLQNGSVLDGLIKTHVKEEPGKTTGLWKTDDIEDAVANYNEFLCSVAQKGNRLSKGFLLQRLKKLFKTDAVTLEDFSGKMSQALRYCHEKGKRYTSGKKTSQAALKVITAYGLQPTSKSSASDLELPCIDEGVSVMSSQSEDSPNLLDIEESDTEGDGAKAALQAAKGMYQKYSGSAAASSADVVDLTSSPKKTSQVPPNPDEACTGLIQFEFMRCAGMTW